MITTTCGNLNSSTSMSLVGDFEVRHDGAVVEVPLTAQRLLCFLALNTHPVRRYYVSGVLWPDADDRHAGASLRSAMWRVPSPGDHRMLGTSTTHIWLDRTVHVDLRSLIEQSTAMFAPGAPSPGRADVNRLLPLYGHDLLTGWYDDWAVTERERFRQIRLHVLDQIGERLFEAGDHHEALTIALAVVAADPLRESAQRLLVRLHLREGNVAEAFRLGDAYADQLHRELGASPSAAMTDLLAPHRCARS